MTVEQTILTLCLIHEHPRILLGMKKRGFGAGRWNGFGGKVGEGESIEEAARRELLEESGIHATYMEKRGILYFDFQDSAYDAGQPAQKPLEVHVFKVEEFRGLPIETEEMKPEWFYVEEIPFARMWSDDLYWVPLFIKGRKFRGRFLFDRASTAEYSSKIIEKNVQEVAELD